jgi:hypothetical protein
MFVGDGDDEAINLPALQLLAQRGKAGFMGLHQHLLILG